MVIFPIGTDRRIRSTPWVNYVLIAANVLIFLFTERQINLFHQIAASGGTIDEAMRRVPLIRLFLWPEDHRQWYQFITYQFLHDGKMHLFFNMVFLYVFGNGVEDRLGKVGYLFFYLAAGVYAAIGHANFDANPILGASGSIAGVTGAYLVLFPLSYVTIFYVFDTFEVSSIVLILFRVAQDALFQVIGHAGVAYLAHLVGYGFGFVVAMSLRVLRFVPRESYDMLALIEQRRRRAQFRRLARQGYHAWETPPKPIAAPDQAVTGPNAERLKQLRTGISAALGQQEMSEAARLYGQLLELDGGQVMAQQQQLDLANQLMAETRYDAAAAAYELFLENYASYPQRHQVQLILGLIYARYLEQNQRARALLTEAVSRLEGEDKRLATTVLGEIDN